MTTARLQLPPKLIPVFAPSRGSVRYRGAWGGRGSGKSFNFAKMAAVWGVVEPLRILCCRDLQTSIKESFHAELKNAIDSEPWLKSAYDVGVDFLRSKINGTEFLFKGLRHNIGSVKSLAQIDLCILEEAEDIAEEAWLALEPTIRAAGSEIWTLWNPRLEGSPVDRRLRVEDPGRARIAEMNFRDNPWFPKELEELRLKQKRTMDDETYRWIWEGAYLQQSKASIFAGHWQEDTRTPDASWHGPYHGLDFGFSQDPTAGVRCWISPDERELYVDREAVQVKLELDDTAKFLKQRIPGIEAHTVYADNARPESIAHLKRNRSPTGQVKADYLPRILAVAKGAGSVEDGIAHLKSYDIIVSPDCPLMQEELRRYSYKVDRLSGDVLPTIASGFDHLVDALRYSVEAVMRAKGAQVGMLLKG